MVSPLPFLNDCFKNKLLLLLFKFLLHFVFLAGATYVTVEPFRLTRVPAADYSVVIRFRQLVGGYRRFGTTYCVRFEDTTVS
jgi:hypothetical protein